MIDRRQFLVAGSSLTALSLMPSVATVARAQSSIEEGLQSSDLVYLSPIRSNGALSKCQAEVWFVQDNSDVVVVSRGASWRVQAARQGLTRTRLWIGDVGVWTRNEGQYLTLPTIDAEANIESDPKVHARILEIFGNKYRASWLFWRGRFKKGLKNGSRVMLRYRLL